MKYIPLIIMIIILLKYPPDNSEKAIRGYVLVGYLEKNLDSNCLKNISGALTTNRCISAMNEYFIRIIPNYANFSSFDSTYIYNSKFNRIFLSVFERRFYGPDVAELLEDSTLVSLKKRPIPMATLSSKMFYNINADKNYFAYRIFEFEGCYIDKIVKNSDDKQLILSGLTNLSSEQPQKDSLNIFLVKKIKYVKEVEASKFRSNLFSILN